MGTLKVTIETDNAAFEDSSPQELARILKRLAEDMETVYDPDGFTRRLRDANGNSVGEAHYEPSPIEGDDEERVTLDGEDLGSVSELKAQQATLAAPAVRTVRVRRSFGGCEALGEFVRETLVSFVYRDADGKVKTKKKGTRPPYAGAPRPAPHVEPCTSCTDHPQSRYGQGRCGIHGNVEPCETCMST